MDYFYDATFTEVEVSTLVDKVGKVDILILNAAQYCEEPFPNLSPSTISDFIEINAIAPYTLLKEMTNELSRSCGQVISRGSKAEEFLMVNSEIYSISKRVWLGLLKAYEPTLKAKGIYLTHCSLPRIGEFFGVDIRSACDLIISNVKNKVNSHTFVTF